MRPAHLIALLWMNVFWAGSYSVFKMLAPRLTAGEIVTWRFGLAAVVLAAAWRWLPGRAPRGLDLARVAVMGVIVFTLSPRLQVLGVHLGRAGDASIVIALEPLVTAVAAALFLREHVPARRWAGFSLGMVGVLLLNGAWRLELHGPLLWANLVFLSSFVCESMFSVIGKPILQRASILKTIACALFFGVAFNLALDGPTAIPKAASLTRVDWVCLAYLAGVCTLVGYTLWYVVIREADVTLAALTILIQPLFGVLAAVLWLGETLHWGHLWGICAILGGILLGFARPRVSRSWSMPEAQTAGGELPSIRPD